MRLLFFIILKGSFPITIKPVSLQSWKVYASEYETASFQLGHTRWSNSWWVCGPSHSGLGQGLAGQALGADWRMESEVRLRDAQGRWADWSPSPWHQWPLLEFLNNWGETCPFKFTNGTDYSEKIKSKRRRAFKKAYAWKTPSNSALVVISNGELSMVGAGDWKNKDWLF